MNNGHQMRTGIIAGILSFIGGILWFFVVWAVTLVVWILQAISEVLDELHHFFFIYGNQCLEILAVIALAAVLTWFVWVVTLQLRREV